MSYDVSARQTELCALFRSITVKIISSNKIYYADALDILSRRTQGKAISLQSFQAFARPQYVVDTSTKNIREDSKTVIKT